MWWDVYVTGSSTFRRIDQMRYRGGTASQACDPSNDIDRWRSQFSGVFDLGGNQKWGIGPTSYLFNCDPHFNGVIVRYPSQTKTYDLQALYQFKRVSDRRPSSTFTSNEWWTVKASNGAQPPRFAQIFT